MADLPVVAWQDSEHGSSFISDRAKTEYPDARWQSFYTIALTPQAPAQAALEQARAEVERLKSAMQEQALQALSDDGQWIEHTGRLQAEVARLTEERDAAFAMSRCECSSDEACANLVAASREVEALREDAERYRFWRARWKTQFALSGPGKLKMLGTSPSAIERSFESAVDAAIDASLKSPTPGKEQT